MKRRDILKGSAIVSAVLTTQSFSKKQFRTLCFPLPNARSIRCLTADKTMVGTLPVLRAFAGNHTGYVSPYVFFDEFGV